MIFLKLKKNKITNVQRVLSVLQDTNMFWKIKQIMDFSVSEVETEDHFLNLVRFTVLSNKIVV